MEDSKIIQGNKLIAEFLLPSVPWNDSRLGPIRLYAKPGHTSPHCRVTELEYHESWDWLMPVVETIISFNTNFVEMYADKHGSSVGFGSSYNQADEFGKHRCHINVDYDDETRQSLITSTWKACVDFIEWYNTQKQNQ